MKTKEEKSELLQSLLDHCNDSCKGYEKAADAAKGASMKLHMHNIALERADFGISLSELVKSNGGAPSKGGTFKGAVHRNWRDFQDLMANTSEEHILKEALRGERRLIEDYVETVQKGRFEQESERVLTRQLANVQSRVDRMETLLKEVA